MIGTSSLQQLFDDVAYAYSFSDLNDVICGRCNHLHACIDNVIKVFEEIQTCAEKKTVESQSLEKSLTGNKTRETEQNNTGTQRKVESWWWKLYEKTVKVVVDALLDKVWPK